MDHGYRSIDTASIYQNEEVIGEALQEIFASGKVRREEIYITTKFWYSEKNDIEAALKSSMEKLRLDYIDLYLMHNTVPNIEQGTKNLLPTLPVHK